MLESLSNKGFDIYIIGEACVPSPFRKLAIRNFLGCYFVDSSCLDKYKSGVCIFDKKLFLWLILSRMVSKSFLWGIGKGNNFLVNKMRAFVSNRSLGIISYMPLNDASFKTAGYIVNSVFSEAKFSWSNSYKLLFIGGLNKRKRIDVLISALKICHSLNYYFTLDVIGDGQERNKLERMVQNLNLSKFVNFHGHISESCTKADVIKGSFLSVSPGQAGLSILESMSYGIPFLTSRNAISGGEIKNISDCYNGYLVDDYKDPIELALKMIKIKQDENIEQVSMNAHDYFTRYANGHDMTKRFLDIVEGGCGS